MKLYALVDQNNIVENVIVWDGETYWEPPENIQVVEVPLNAMVSVGYRYEDGSFKEILNDPNEIVKNILNS